MQIKKALTLIGLLLVWGQACSQAPKEKFETKQSQAKKGIIYAEPENLSVNIPLSKVLEISGFFHDPANKVQIQFPNDNSRYAWVNMSKFYTTAQVERSGKIADLEYAIDPSMGDVSYQNLMGESLRVDSHFAALPIDALIAVKGGKGLYISPANDMVVAWFCTSTGTNQEEAMARAIVKSLTNQ